MNRNWIHEGGDNFSIFGDPWISLKTDSKSEKWILTIHKNRSALGIPVTYEVWFKRRYAESQEAALALSDIILDGELAGSSR